MKISFNLVRCVFISLLLSCASLQATSTVTKHSTQVHIIKQAGVFPSPEGRCTVSLEIAEMGGFLAMSVISESQEHNEYNVNDVTGIAWVNENDLVYTVSPIYGKPGIFLYDCISLQSRKILGPKIINKGYPNGADFFELQDFSSDEGGLIYFHYAPDIELVDFNKFRTRDFLFQINLDGTGFKKALQKRDNIEN